MASQCVADLESHLRDMLSLKPPGVTSTKISKIAELCNANVQSESILIQRIYTHFKKAPATHKLGVLYVVDSVTRGWVEQAKKNGQSVKQTSPPAGTYAAGVNHVTQLLPSIMNDIINSAPEAQKEKIVKLVTIWERADTFPQDQLSGFKQKLAEPPENERSTTPTGTPPPPTILTSATAQSALTGQNAAPDTSKILQALADMAKTNVGGSQNQGAPTIANPATSATNIVVPRVDLPAGTSGSSMFGGAVPNSSFPNSNVSGLPSGTQPNVAGQSMSPEVLQQQVQLIQLLQAQGVPPENLAAVVSVLMSTGAVPGTQATHALGGNSASQPWNAQNQGSGAASSRDANAFQDVYGRRSPPDRNRGQRSRSRSPPRGGRQPGYDYRQGEGRGRDFRQRSPDHSNQSGGGQHLPPPGPRNIEIDRTLPQGCIRVLSRTLFVGGVTAPEKRIREIFSEFGTVQTCIINLDKRHAFVKMVNRPDAVRAKDGMEHYRSPDMALRTRWGVGFGPRDCSNYQTGVSVIPIDRLTDADRKWLLTAEYGGTGGASIEQFQVVEEPDIEIGAGVSSKAISRRIATDTGGYSGPRSTREPPGPSNNNNPNTMPRSRFRQPDRRDQHGDDRGYNDNGNNYNDSNQNNNNNNGGGGGSSNQGPGNAGFNMPFPGMPNGFQFPQGFMFPNGMGMPQQQQPPSGPGGS